MRVSIETRIKNELLNFDGCVGVYANDLKNNVVDYQADEIFETASCMKLFVLIELFRQVYLKEKSLDDMITYQKENYADGSGIIRFLTPGLKMPVRDFAFLMMDVSDNIATNILIDYLGMDKINHTLERLGCKTSRIMKKFDTDWKHTFGLTTPREYGRLFELIAKRKLWNRYCCEEMINILKNQKYTELIGEGLPKCYTKVNGNDSDIIVYTATKSGKVKGIRNDGGIVSTIFGDYVITVFIKGFQDEFNLNDVPKEKANAINLMIFDQFVALEGRFYLNQDKYQPYTEHLNYREV